MQLVLASLMKFLCAFGRRMIKDLVVSSVTVTPRVDVCPFRRNLRELVF